MPYKIDVYNYLLKLNRLEKNAKIVWAVNTLFKKDWKIYWTNTDLEWISWPIIYKGLKPSVDKIDAYILWAGWASRAAIAAMIELKIENIFILNRSQKNLDEIENHFKKYLWNNQKIITKIYDVESPHSNTLPWGRGDSKIIIINTLPFWFKENLPKSPIKFEELEKIKNNLELYFEAIYDSERWNTPIVEFLINDSESSSEWQVKICRWIEMLIWQAKTWFELWSNWWEFKSEEITKVLMKSKKENQ
jgi:shikimate 5-dehydrogenase